MKGPTGPRSSFHPTDIPEPPHDLGPDHFRLGQRLGGSYELLRVLGAGGMGEVYEARDHVLRRTVAIKVPTTPGAVVRLVQEGRALAAVHHPSLVRVHHMAYHEDVPYLVMERIVGTTLEAHIERRQEASQPYGIREAIDLLITIAEGLAHVHDAGVAHRDVKPANVMLSGQRVVIMDFGLVLPEFAAGRGVSLIGSPAYMAPEIITGELRPGEAHLTDLYGLGTLGFELLTGRVPFEGGEDEVVAAILQRHLEAQVPDIREIRPDVPEGLAQVLTEMLAKSPGDRLATMSDVVWRLKDLRRRLESASLTEPPRVLIVDDDPPMAELMGAWVEEVVPGVQVEIAGTAEEALGKTAEVDLMIVDLDLPGMNGAELCMYLKGGKAGEALSMMVVSGTAAPEDVTLLKGLGIDAFAAKGTELETELTRLLQRRFANYLA